MAISFSITQHIPVSNHVYKYLLAKCGSDTIEVSRTNLVGSIVLSLLNRNGDIKPGKSNHTKVFNVVIKENFYNRNGINIGPRNAKLFNDMFDKMFREELYCHIIMNKSELKEMFIESIRNFLEVYGIDEDDIKLETLYKDFKRKRSQKEALMNLKKTA